MSNEPVGEGGLSGWTPARSSNREEDDRQEWENAIRALRSEVRVEAQDLEAVAGELGNSTRDLMDALIDAGMDGFEVMLELPPGPYVGRIVHGGEDVVTLETRGGVKALVVLHHVGGTRISPVRSDSARVNRGHPMTLVAELRRRVAEDESAEILRTLGEAVCGVIEGVSESHVQLSAVSGATWIIPLRSIVAVL